MRIWLGKGKGKGKALAMQLGNKGLKKKRVSIIWPESDQEPQLLKRSWLIQQQCDLKGWGEMGALVSHMMMEKRCMNPG
jgi:hypothetical protein